MPADEERQRQDRSFVIRADAPDRPARLGRCSGSAAPDGQGRRRQRRCTPPAHYVDGLSWSPDGREIAYSAAPRTGFSAPYETRVYAIVRVAGRLRRAPIVDRTGMNTGPRFSPDGRQIAFISTSGRTDIMAPRSLTVAPLDSSGQASRDRTSSRSTMRG